MTIEDALKHAISLLGVTFPINSQEFKIAYRRACFLHHPDRGGNEEQFKKIQEIYQLVKNDSSLICESKENIIQLLDGTPISLLGMGLGPTINGKDCKDCLSKGYTIEYERGKGTCSSCNGTGERSAPCRACKGTGKFKLRSDREVECRDCKGSGRFTHATRRKGMFRFWGEYRDSYCLQCGGGGWVITDDKFKPRYYRGYKCEGTGEIPIYNPVIPKGSLSGKKR